MPALFREPVRGREAQTTSYLPREIGRVFEMLRRYFLQTVIPVTPNVWIRNITDARKYILSWPGTLRGCRHDGGSSTTSGEEPRAVVRPSHHYLKVLENASNCLE